MIGAFLFCTGLLIVIINKNAIFVMIGIELMLNGANVNLVVFSGSDPNIQGQLMMSRTINTVGSEIQYFDLSLLNSGIYLVKVTSNNDRAYKRVVIR